MSQIHTHAVISLWQLEQQRIQFCSTNTSTVIVFPHYKYISKIVYSSTTFTESINNSHTYED